MAVENVESLPGFADDAAVMANVRKVVRTLMLLEDMEPEAVADALGIGRSTFYNRLSESGAGSRFTVTEVYRLSRLFGVSVGTFYNPPELSAFSCKREVSGQRRFTLAFDNPEPVQSELRIGEPPIAAVPALSD